MGRTTRRWVRPSSRPVVDRSSAVGMHLLLLAAAVILALIGAVMASPRPH
jgi:hypothetical protein